MQRYNILELYFTVVSLFLTTSVQAASESITTTPGSSSIASSPSSSSSSSSFLSTSASATSSSASSTTINKHNATSLSTTLASYIQGSIVSGSKLKNQGQGAVDLLSGSSLTGSVLAVIAFLL